MPGCHFVLEVAARAAEVGCDRIRVPLDEMAHPYHPRSNSISTDDEEFKNLFASYVIR